MNTNFSKSKVRIFKNVNPKNEPIHLIFPCSSNFLLSKNLNQHFHRHFERALTFSLNRYFSIESFQFLLIWENLETDGQTSHPHKLQLVSFPSRTKHLSLSVLVVNLTFVQFRSLSYILEFTNSTTFFFPNVIFKTQNWQVPISGWFIMFMLFIQVIDMFSSTWYAGYFRCWDKFKLIFFSVRATLKSKPVK